MNKYFICLLTVLCFSIFNIGKLKAQTETDFWFVAPDADVAHGPSNANGDRPTFFMITTGNLPADVTIDMPKNPAFTKAKKHIPANSFWKYSFEGNDIALIENVITDAGKVTNKGVHITSTAPVSAYYQFDGPNSKEIFTLKGSKALGKKFYTPFQLEFPSYQHKDAYAQIHIVATEDNTTITLKPTADIVAMVAPNVGSGLTGTVNTIKLNKGETFIARKVKKDKDDPSKLNGSYIESDKPIAVTVGDDTVDMGGWDMCGDQLVPIDGLGTNYVVVKGYTANIPAGSKAADYIYILATQDNTTVELHGDVANAATVTIDAGQTYKYKMGYNGEPGTNNVCYVKTSKPAYCLHQSGIGVEIGASILPSMYSVASRQITLYNERKTTYNDLYIVFHDDALNSFLINGNSLILSGVKPVPGLAGWNYAKSSILGSSAYEGATRISNSKGAFALGYFYGNTGNMALYGYLSNFGAFSFDADTVYKCKGASYILDGGYAKGYEWKNAAGTVVGNTQKLTVDNPGKYTLKLDQDVQFAYDTIWVLDRNFSTANIVYTGINPQKIYINEPGMPSAKSYEWKLNGGAVTYTTDTITVDWTSMPNKNFEVTITDIESGCDTTLTGKYTPAHLPDNISDATCVTERPKQQWSIQNIKSAYRKINPYQNAVVGDIDNDGRVEILVGIDAENASSIPNRWANKIAVYRVEGGALNLIRTIQTKVNYNWDAYTKYAIVKTKINNVANTPIIVVAENDRKLRAYKHNHVANATPLWESNAEYHATINSTISPNFYDLDKDGIPEILIANKIFNSSNGHLVGTLPTFAIPLPGNESMPIAIEQNNGTGNLSVVYGNSVYAVNNTLPSAGFTVDAAKTVKVVMKTDPADKNPVVAVPDGGRIAVADIDLDGELDLILSYMNNMSNYTYICVADPKTGVIKASKYFDKAGTSSYPFVGDVDGDGKPEILFISLNSLVAKTDMFFHAYKYDGTKILKEFWKLAHTDASGLTAMTLFDFNSDGISEIVYRDETDLRIINGSKKHHETGAPVTAPYNLAAFPCFSGTSTEYPVVADVDGDGQAEILIGGAINKTDSDYTYYSGVLWMFKSGDPAKHPWAPARKVWNQYAYNSLNINEDLTVPIDAISPATVFAGKGGVPVRPFNAFLQQQTVLNSNGMPLSLAPAGKIIGSPDFVYNTINDSLFVSVEVKNIGEVAFQSPFNITVYKDAVGNPKKFTYKYTDDIIKADASVIIRFGIPKFKAEWIPFTNLVIHINDSGNGFNDQAVCDSLSRDFKAGTILASDDNTLLFENSIDNKIKVTVNDIKPCNNPKIEIVEEAKRTRYPSTVINDSVIVYTPAQYYEGLDSIKYLIHCGDISKSDTATLYIKVVKAPDNVSDATCVTTPPVSEWGIREVPNSLGDIFSTLQTTLVADIDGDKVPEILALNSTGDKVYVLNGDGTLKATGSNFTTNPINIVKTNAGVSPLVVGRVQWLPNDYKTVMYTMSTTTDHKLRAYDVSNGALLWTSTVLFNNGTHASSGASVQVADLDGDGWSELVVGNKVFSAEKGILLCTAGANLGIIHGWDNATFLIHSMAGDVLGNGKQQVCVGNMIYEVNIANRAVSGGVNTMTQAGTIVPKVWNGTALETLTITDGAVQLADIDLDGNLDIIVSTVKRDEVTFTNSIFYMYVWSPSKNEIIASKKINRVYKRGVPFIGNIDKTNPYPEIIFTRGGTFGNFADLGHDKITALQYDPTSVNKELKTFWELNHSDVSGATGITLFDFNQDKISELVYRDNNNLRIINGSGVHHVTNAASAPYDLATIACSSATCYEYPVVADIDGDGQAEIVVTGNHAFGHRIDGPIRIFKAAFGTSWAPARKVWNQYPYNAVHVNEDLTVVKYPMNPSAIFPGEDGILGTTDDTRPYNAFLQQQTMLNKFGMPLWLAANAQKLGLPSFSYDAANDSLIVSLKIYNAGSAALQDSVKVTAYKNNIGNAVKYTYGYPHKIMPGETAVVTFGISKFKEKWYNSLPAFSEIVIQINDNGNGYNYQPVCDSTARDYHTGKVIASDDRVLLFKNSTDNKIMVTLNDIKTCTDPKVTIVTAPQHGVAGIVTDSIIQYTPAADYIGNDTIKYRITCGADSYEAMIYITVIEMPDNISDADCYVAAPQTVWAIDPAPLKSTANNLSTLVSVLVGDLDGNGKPEIVAVGESDHSFAQSIYIFKDGDITSAPVRINTPALPAKFWVRSFPIAIAKINGEGVIFVALDDDHIYAYKANGAPYWAGTGKSNAPWLAPADKEADWAHLPFIGVADFDGDGNEEVYVGNRIFDAKTGNLLLTAGGIGLNVNKGMLLSGIGTARQKRINSLAADVNNDGKLELLAGNTAYSINVTDRTNPLNNTWSIVHTAALPASPWGAITDGYAQVADFNNDGNLDVLVTQGDPNNPRVYFAAYSPATNEILGHFVFTGTTGLNKNGPGMPFIGDIDGDGVMEVIFTSPKNIDAYDYNIGTGFAHKWNLPTSDESGCTGVTLFDFNQDNKAELVYRDQTHLRILDGTNATTIQTNLARFECNSATVMEYPVVVDYDGDGSAEILIVGGAKTGVANEATFNGSITIYKSSATKWAPARKVWNQFGYNAVNVNNDLSIPKVQLNPATVFPGVDGQLGTSDDVRPYNGFLQQQTTLNKNGNPLWLVPNAQTNGLPSFVYDVAKDSLIVTIKIHNAGDAALQDSVKVTAYKNNIGNAIKYTYGYPHKIIPGETAVVTFGISKFKENWTPYNDIVIQINDNGNGYNDQPVCDSLKREFRTGKVIAADDRVLLFKNSTDNKIMVTVNDIKSCTNPLVTIVTAPQHGVAGIVTDSIIQYSPAADYIGNDTIKYKIACGADSYEAMVYITVIEMPDNISDANCVIAPVAQEWKIRESFGHNTVILNNLAPVYVGDLNNDGVPEIVSLTRAILGNSFVGDLIVFKGPDHKAINTIPAKGSGYHNWGGGGVALLKARINGKDSAFIVAHDMDGYLYAFNMDGVAISTWGASGRSDIQVAPAAVAAPWQFRDIGVADFNNDGIPEIYCGKYIFNAVTGKKICESPGNFGYATSFGKWDGSSTVIDYYKTAPTVADIDGDGQLEYIAGNQVYKVNIAAGTMTLLHTVTPPTDLKGGGLPNDGKTSVADIDLDGHLDIIVSGTVAATHRSFIWAWSPAKNKVLARTSTDYARNQSMPLIGDIDGDGKAEIVSITSNQATNDTQPLYDSIRAYKFDGTDMLLEFWRMPHSDRSGNTGMTLFDFNQDNIVEIVYRDESHLRIINGSGKDHVTGLPRAPYNLSRFQCSSATGNEYPVIADIDGDGSAEIIVNGHPTNTTFPFDHAPLRIFKSGAGTSWAPARKVWNQYAYNAVNINEDLTVPKIQLSPATVFPGVDGVLGTSDDVRPYNGFLQQQTTLNKFGTPLWLAPNAQAVGTPSFVYDVSKDSLIVTIKIHNAGDAALQDSVKVTAYKNNIGNAVKYTYGHPHKIMPGETAVVTFGISKFKEEWTPYNDLVIQINDNGNGLNDQPVCDDLNRKYHTGKVIASDDRVLLAKNSTNNRIEVTLNDIKSCTNPKVTIVTAPQHGTAGIVPLPADSIILYSPAADYIGNDTIKYRIACGADSYEAMVYITVIEMPDNISSANCVITPPKTDWDIQRTFLGKSELNAMVPPIAGDLNGDGFPEIIALNQIPNELGMRADKMYIYDGKKISEDPNALPRIISLGTGVSVQVRNPGSMAVAKVDLAGNGVLVPIIIVACGDNKLRAYNPAKAAGTELAWTSTETTAGLTNVNALVSVNIADFNNDGHPEVYTANRIFDAADGKLLVKGIGNKGLTDFYYGTSPNIIKLQYHITHAADMLGDANLELVAGSQVYEVKIDSRTNPALNSMTVARELPANTAALTNFNKDGNTFAIDINQDGKLDVVCRSNYQSSTHPNNKKIAIFAWDVETQALIASIDFVDDQAFGANPNFPGQVGLPFVGDIDGNGKSELMVLTTNRLRVFDLNTATQKFVQRWIYPIVDGSGCTSITLFDFNQDKTVELVYRDETHLRIMNATATGLETRESIFCGSGTVFEHPIIVDINNDGNAEVVVIGSPTVPNDPKAPGALMILGSKTPGAWAPARRVWNQFAYNVVNINDDLTVPKVQQKPTTPYPGVNGVLGDGDDVHPFNTFMQQATMLNMSGLPLWLAPEAQIDPVYTTYYDIVGDSLTINVKVSNTGSAALGNPIHVTVYKNAVATTSVKHVHQYLDQIAVGESAIIPVTIKNFTTWLGATDDNTTLIVKVNDKGLADNDQPVCRDGNVKLSIKFSSLLKANNDTVRVLYPGAVVEFDVLANDSLKTCTRGTLTAFDTIANSGLHLGTLDINADSTFKYTSTVGKYGVDSVDYYIKCNADSATARAYILVNNPKALNYIACLPQKNTNGSGQADRPTIVNLGFASIPDVTYTWYPTKISTIPVTGGVHKDTLTVEVKTAADFKSWWVEPEWNGIKFERIEVTLSESSSCGDALSDCAKDGTVLFREDFEGNDPADPETKASGIPEVSAIYGYRPVSGDLLRDSEYAIVKNGRGGGGSQTSWWKVNDHKNPGETRNGYMLQVNADKNPGQYYERELTGLCAGNKLFFSAWIINVLKNVYAVDKVNARFLIEHNNVVIAEYTTGAILESKHNDTTAVKWRMYGFDFIVPDGVDNLKLRIINDGIGSAGNDFVMDDIEIRFCAPRVNVTPGKDSMVCEGSRLDLNSSYTDNGTFGQDLKGRWERLNETTGTWELYRTEVTSNNGQIDLPVTIDPFQDTDEGYYRVVIGSPGAIDKVNCRAVSDSIHFTMIDNNMVFPDVRVQVCPNPNRQINLSSYVDSTGVRSINWKINGITVAGGKVQTNTLTTPSTYHYGYAASNGCINFAASLYLTVLKDRILGLPPDTVLVCQQLASSQHIQLNTILGIDASGTWSYGVPVNPDNTVVDNVTPITSGDFNGGYLFNAKKAWLEATDAGYKIPSFVQDPNAKMFKFKYTAGATSCVPGISKEFIIIVTEKIVP